MQAQLKENFETSFGDFTSTFTVTCLESVAVLVMFADNICWREPIKLQDSSYCPRR